MSQMNWPEKIAACGALSASIARYTNVKNALTYSDFHLFTVEQHAF
jgi:hypothetical protein